MGLAGVLVADVFVSFAPGVDDDTQWQVMHPGYTESERVNWDILIASNLVKEVGYTWTRGSLEYRVRAFMFTELGGRFYFACHTPDWQDKISDEVPFVRRHKAQSEARAQREAKETIGRLGIDLDDDVSLDKVTE